MMFDALFKPIEIGKVTIKNRIAFAPMGIGAPMITPEGELTQRGAEYFLERAKGGTGLIITSGYRVMPLPNLSPPHIFLRDNLQIWGELTDYVHAYGSKIFLQLGAGGGRNTGGTRENPPVSASAIPSVRNPNVICRELTTAEIEAIIDAHGRKAHLAKTAGIDGIDINGHNGHLIDQFMTALWNRRTDEYGGDLERRLKFPIGIVERIKEVAGKDFPVVFRMGAKHFIKGSTFPYQGSLTDKGFVEAGRDIQESIEIAKRFERAGVDALDVDIGSIEGELWSHPPTYQPSGFNVEIISEIKNAINIPVIIAGRLGVPKVADTIIREGKADIIALARPLAADPYWPIKVRDGRVEDIRPCTGCNIGCLGHGHRRPFSCTVNPSCAREQFAKLTPAARSKNVLIAGGGLAGMEAARVATIRGHKVTLYERSGELGGHLIEAAVPEFKYDMKLLLDWYLTQLRKLKIAVKFNTEVTSELVERENPDTVIVATGSTVQIPEIPGIKDNPMVTDCCNLLRSRTKAGAKVVILGGGLEGCETALWLAKQGKSVTVIARHAILPRGIARPNKMMLLLMLAENAVTLLPETRIEEVSKSSVIVESGRRRSIDCDTVVLAMGLEPEKELYSSLMGEVVDIYEIGDGKEPGQIREAIWDGFAVGSMI